MAAVEPSKPFLRVWLSGCTKTRNGEIRNRKWGNAEMRIWGMEERRDSQAVAEAEDSLVNQTVFRERACASERGRGEGKIRSGQTRQVFEATTRSCRDQSDFRSA